MYTITLVAQTATGYDKDLIYSWDCPLCDRKIHPNLDLEYVHNMTVSHMINGHSTKDKFLRVVVDLLGRIEEPSTTNSNSAGIHPSHVMRAMLRATDKQICANCLGCGCHYMSQLLKPCIVPPHKDISR